MRPLPNPRSALHAQKPLGLGTPAVESLLSYFCRLAVSHSVSVVTLAQHVSARLDNGLREDFVWHERNLSGLGSSALDWAGALSALTSVERLDGLTLAPWREVLSPKGSARRSHCWCPRCFAADQAGGRPPYFQLSWDLPTVTACHEHQVELVDACPHCGRSKARHAAAYVMPGWCVHCGGFLGDVDPDRLQPAHPKALWAARQCGLLLERQATLTDTPGRSGFELALHALITRMDAGQGAAFARRIGMGKATVHNWIKGGGLPTLQGALQVAAHSGLSLPDLLTGNVSDWSPPTLDQQMALSLVYPGCPRRETPRQHDWQEIRQQIRGFCRLPTPISVAEAARRLDVSSRHLYLQANRETRMLGERWTAYLSRRRENRLAEVRPMLEAACRDILNEGKAISLREIEQRVPREALASVESLFNLLQEIREELKPTG